MDKEGESSFFSNRPDRVGTIGLYSLITAATILAENPHFTQYTSTFLRASAYTIPFAIGSRLLQEYDQQNAALIVALSGIAAVTLMCATAESTSANQAQCAAFSLLGSLLITNFFYEKD